MALQLKIIAPDGTVRDVTLEAGEPLVLAPGETVVIAPESAIAVTTEQVGDDLVLRTPEGEFRLAGFYNASPEGTPETALAFVDEGGFQLLTASSSAVSSSFVAVAIEGYEPPESLPLPEGFDGAGQAARAAALQLVLPGVFAATGGAGGGSGGGTGSSAESDGDEIFAGLSGTNDPPSFAPGQAFSIAENAAAGSVLGTVLAIDDEQDPFTFSIVGGTGAGFFAIDPNSGVLSVVNPAGLDREATAGFTLRIRAVETADPTRVSETEIDIRLDGVNEFAPQIVSSNVLATFENTTAVGTVVATDADVVQPAGTLTFTIAGGADAARFTIDPSSGALAFSVAPDFENPIDGGADNVYDVVVRVTDEGGLFTDRALSVTVNDANDPPAGADVTVNAAEDTTYVFTPADFAGFSDAADASPDALAGIVVTTLPGVGNLFVQGVGPVAAGTFVSIASITAGDLRWTPPADAAGNALTTMTFQVRDDGGTGPGGSNLDPTPNTLTFDVTPANDIPVIDLNGADGAGIDFAASFVEPATAGSPIPLAIVDTTAGVNGLTVTEVDGDNIQQATATLRGGPIDAGAVELLDVNVGATGLVKNYDTVTGVLTLTGVASPAVYQQVLRTLTYNHTSDTPTAGARLVDVVVQDQTGADSLTATSTVTVTVTNDNPVIGGTTGATVTEAGTGTNTVALVTGATVADADAANFAGGSIVVTFTDGFQAGDVLSLAGGNAQTGIASVTGGNASTLTINLNAGATAGQVATLLNDLRYQNTGDDPTAQGADGDRQYSIVLNDGGNSPGPNAASNTLAGTITVTGENDAPVVGGTVTNPTATEVGTGTNTVALMTGATVVDADAANFAGGSIVVTFTDGFQAGDVLSLAGGNGQAGIANVSGGGATALTIDLNAGATAAQVATLLNDLRYRNTGDDPTAQGTDGDRQYSIVLNDGGNNPGPNAASVALTGTVTVTGENDAPVVDANGAGVGADHVAGYEVEAGPQSIIDAAATVFDADSATLATVTVTLTNRLDGDGNEALSVTDGGGVTSTYTPGTGVLLLTGPAGAAAFETVLRTLQYTNTSTAATVDTTPRVVTIQADDGAGANNLSAVTTITVGLSTAPVVDLNGADDVGVDHAAAFVESALPGSTPVSIVDTAVDPNGLTVVDQDGDNLSQATVTLRGGPTDGGGVELLDVNVGATGIVKNYNPGTGVLTLTGNATAADYQQVLKTLTYEHTSNDPTAGVRLVDVVVRDVNAVNSAVATTTVTVTATNDEPTLSATGVNPIFAENGASQLLYTGAAASTVEVGQTFTGLTLTVASVVDGVAEVLSLDGSTVSLTDGNGGTTATNGLTFAVTVGGGTATVTLSGGGLSAGALQTLVNGLGYQNTSEDPTAGNRTVTLTSVTDSGSNVAPNDAVATLNVVSTVTVVPVNDEPTLTATGTDPTFTEDGPSQLLYAGSAASTVESAQTFTGLTLTVTNVVNGASERLSVDGSTVQLTNGNSGTTATNGLGFAV
ncbi:MAG: beta strand repeat-containing protein, partial [Gammaproteobacteria bacterium]